MKHEPICTAYISATEKDIGNAYRLAANPVVEIKLTNISEYFREIKLGCTFFRDYYQINATVFSEIRHGNPVEIISKAIEPLYKGILCQTYTIEQDGNRITVIPNVTCERRLVDMKFLPHAHMANAVLAFLDIPLLFDARCERKGEPEPRDLVEYKPGFEFRMDLMRYIGTKAGTCIMGHQVTRGISVSMSLSRNFRVVPMVDIREDNYEQLSKEYESAYIRAVFDFISDIEDKKCHAQYSGIYATDNLVIYLEFLNKSIACDQYTYGERYKYILDHLDEYKSCKIDYTKWREACKKLRKLGVDKT
jgi:hypothetical protein